MLLQPKHLTRRPMVMALSDADVIGDPFGGPASGSCEKSKGLGMVIGVVASVFTAGAGFALWQGGQMLAGGAMMAGGVMSGVGAVTGNQKLAKIGGVLSLAGGLTSAFGDVAGSSISSVNDGAGGSFGSSLSKATSDFGASFKEVVGLGDSAAATAVDGNIKVVEGATDAASSAASGMADASTIPVTDASSGFIKTSATQPGGASTSQWWPGGDATINQGGVGSGVGASAQDLSAYPPLSEGSGPSMGYDGGGFSRSAASLPAGSENAQGGLLSQANGWLKDNQLLASMGMQVGGGLLSGAGQGAAAEEKLALETEKWATMKDEMARQTANINGGVVFLDPNSPNYATAAANAQAAGRTVRTIGVNQNAGPVQLNNGFMATSTPQQQATQRA